MVPSRPFQDLLIATVSLKMTRLMLQELIRLAAQAPGLIDEQLRFRLLALAACATPHFPVPSRSPAGRWLSETPDSAPGGQPAPQHHRECAVRRQRAAEPWPHLVRILPEEVVRNEC
jgi:hypothetical protein